jgi:hypothetical protein
LEQALLDPSLLAARHSPPSLFASSRLGDRGEIGAKVRQAKPAQVVEVKDTMSLKDDTVEIILHNIPNPHSDGMILDHLATANIVWVTDIWSPGREASRTPGVLGVYEAVKKIGIKDATFAGGHGSTAKQSVLEGVAAQN